MNEILVNVASLLVALLLLFSRSLPVRADSNGPRSPDQDGIQQATATPTAPGEISIQPLANQLPVITVWYESSLKFGQNGNPQTQVNILGNVRDPDPGGSIKSLTYRLNSDPVVTIPIGADGRRLVSKGDFNAALDITSLQNGTNTLLLTATDNSGGVQAKTVSFTYTPGRKPPLPYSTRWASAASIQDQAQVVDGLWQLGSGGVRTVQFGYDRLIAIGDISWTDYEVLVPVTARAFYPDPNNPGDAGGIGVIARWKGHIPVDSSPLPWGWWQIGAYGYYSDREKGLTLRFNETKYFTQKFSFTPGVTYLLKLRAETASTGGRYSLKMWVKGQPEPAWNSPQFVNVVNQVDSSNDLLQGSVLLVAHRADATFGDVTVCPPNLPYSLTVNITGSGKVTSSAPGKTRFQCGEGVTLTAAPDPNWTFVGWSGGVTSASPSVSFNVTQPMIITATFRQGQPITYDNSLFLPNIANQ